LEKKEGKEGMILIPAGEFLMGSNDDINKLLQYGTALLPIERPQRKIYLDAYYIILFNMSC